MALLSMIDCAMPFYQNFPSRLTNCELQCDLPCQKSLFVARHPFLEPNFQLSREMTVYQAFQNLFVESGPVRPFFVDHCTNKLHLGIMDMFQLIHRKFITACVCQFLRGTKANIRSNIRSHPSGYKPVDAAIWKRKRKSTRVDHC